MKKLATLAFITFSMFTATAVTAQKESITSATAKKRKRLHGSKYRRTDCNLQVSAPLTFS